MLMVFNYSLNELNIQTLLQKDREQIYFDYHQLKKENDAVKASYEKFRLDASNEPILPMTVEVRLLANVNVLLKRKFLQHALR